MKSPKQLRLGLLLLALLFGIADCAVDARTSPALADALADGPVRDYASLQADTLAQAGFALRVQVVPDWGAPPDLPAAQTSWLRARTAYERGLAVFLVVAAELDFTLDGHLDDGLARNGLRQLETALFAKIPASPTELDRLTATFADAAAALHVAVPDHGRALSAAALIGSLAAVAALIATKFDGSSSPYAGAGLLTIEHDLIGLQAVYAILAPLVASADAALDERITLLLGELLQQVRAHASPDAIADKTALLRKCDELSRALTQVATALGLTATQVNLS